MSIVCLSDVMQHAEAKGGSRLVLFVLAEHAHDDGREAYPAVSTIAERSRMSRKGVQVCLRKLEKEGYVERDGDGPKGQTKWRVMMGGERCTPRVDDDQGGRNPRPEGGEPRSPEPTTEPFIEPPTENARARDARNQPPNGFPDELRPHAREVMRILVAISEGHPGCKRVWPLAVGRVIMAHPRHPLVAVAHELGVWAVNPPRQIKDAVATYQTFLKRASELAAREALADDGTPSAAGPRPTSNGYGQGHEPCAENGFRDRYGKVDQSALRRALLQRAGELP